MRNHITDDVCDAYYHQQLCVDEAGDYKQGSSENKIKNAI